MGNLKPVIGAGAGPGGRTFEGQSPVWPAETSIKASQDAGGTEAEGHELKMIVAWGNHSSILPLDSKTMHIRMGLKGSAALYE